MKNDLDKLLKVVEAPGSLNNLQEIEMLTGKVIANDTYEQLPSHIANIIELLDSPDLNGLKQSDLDYASKTIREYLTAA